MIQSKVKTYESKSVPMIHSAFIDYKVET